MLFIFGFGHQKRTAYGTTEERECPNCHHIKKWKIEKISKWFTLFFLPIFPYKTEYELYCPVCKYGQKLGKEAGRR